MSFPHVSLLNCLVSLAPKHVLGSCHERVSLMVKPVCFPRLLLFGREKCLVTGLSLSLLSPSFCLMRLRSLLFVVVVLNNVSCSSVSLQHLFSSCNNELRKEKEKLDANSVATDSRHQDIRIGFLLLSLREKIPSLVRRNLLSFDNVLLCSHLLVCQICLYGRLHIV